MGTCPHCARELKDYGGYKDKMNPVGINLSDVWKDIPPVRHPKFKRRSDANELSIKLLDRVITMASRPGDLVLDPFGGSGSTYAVAEIKGRRWLGMELGPVDQIIARLQPRNLEIESAYLDDHRHELNALFPSDVLAARMERGLWTPGNIPKGKPRNGVPMLEAEQVEFVLQEHQAGYTTEARAEAKPRKQRADSLKTRKLARAP
jgi:site-specific DNA-methyltransferase (adenine-specific)